LKSVSEGDNLSNVIVFDLDGVITSEEAYWITAGLVLHELLYSPRYWNIAGADEYQPPQSAEECRRLSLEVLPRDVMLGFKAHAINSNWDTCYAAVCLCLIDVLAQLPDAHTLFPLQPWDSAWIARLRSLIAAHPFQPALDIAQAYQRLDEPVFQGYVGLELFDRYTSYATRLFEQSVEDAFAHHSRFWYFCEDIFQAWYLGDTLYRNEYGHAPTQSGKVGCIYSEEPQLPVEVLRTTLQTLQERGYTLGVATGRPGQEAIIPLQRYGLYGYFDPAHIMTQVEVTQAEMQLKQTSGKESSLIKPHPYQFLAAADPAYRPGDALPEPASFVVVGDTTSDVRGGHAANALVIAVLTGAKTALAREMLEASEPDFLVADVTKVPAAMATIDDLTTIQKMQFRERERAELLLQRWFAQHMDLHVEHVKLTPRPVSLNSFNGIYQLDGKEYFFKTHVEDQGVLQEYYHAELLKHAGYEIVQPLRTLHEQGRQMVVYPVIHDPVMFDLMRAVETGDTTQADQALLLAAEERECTRLLDIYARTLEKSSAQEHAQAPIHQLFWHRLGGERLKSFYAEQFFPFPITTEPAQTKDGLTFAELLTYRWTINGQDIGVEDDGYATLGDMIEHALTVLQPEQASYTVIGHGDAHFGNVFLTEHDHYLYFDPAFAGRHAPLLDIVKPFFHNVFATWMYFPQDIACDLQLSVTVHDKRIVLEHNYELTEVRQAMLDMKYTHLLRPLLAFLREHDALPDNWRALFRLALMCCPLLTVNLLDVQKRPASICWLGLAQVMQMGNLPLSLA
jgi:Predicted phosphatases